MKKIMQNYYITTNVTKKTSSCVANHSQKPILMSK